MSLIRNSKAIVLFGLVFFCAVACENEKASEAILLNSPNHFPTLIVPADNQLTVERVRLGKKLFYDKSLSVDNSTSCASCHRPEFAFADNKAVSPGAYERLGNRNAPSLSNIGYRSRFLAEGAVPDLERQVLVPFDDHNEFSLNIVDFIARMKDDTDYQAMSEKAYGRALDAFVVTRSIASFERSFISGGSNYDSFTEKNDSSILSESQLLGLKLFTSDSLACASCHPAPFFSDDELLNNGIYAEYEDPGLFRLTGQTTDIGKFKVPSLRNIGYTAPYMHDGGYASLDEVISHYEQGGQRHANQDTRVAGFELSSAEREALIDFLELLDDAEFVANPALRP